jgi:hypothetical protein
VDADWKRALLRDVIEHSGDTRSRLDAMRQLDRLDEGDRPGPEPEPEPPYDRADPFHDLDEEIPRT